MKDPRDEVREAYGRAAREVLSGGKGCCAPECCLDGTSRSLYDPESLLEVPETAARAALGCGTPVAVAELREGETVLDLGSGGGIDVLLSSRRVGPRGKVYGLDMTQEMLELARRNAAEAGATNVEFLEGTIEDIPLPETSVDVVISNCVINLSVDKPRVFDEISRVLRPGGRIGISDVVAANELTPEQRAERGSYLGCIAGALSFEEYERELARTGFERIEVVPTHEVVDGMFGAIVRAAKPFSPRSPSAHPGDVPEG
ncbi:MAG TPA: arsenite methyltransferase [Actinomycetota bacterium]|nr:arsenite methyltransferase [Actinomycetota bacterium]